jgi:hypothetical protein
MLAVAGIAGTVTWSGGALIATAASQTEVVRWSPFDGSGKIKASMKVQLRPSGNCSGGEGLTYRCFSHQYVLDPCWRDGPIRTEFVVCAPDPWTTTVDRLRSPGLLLTDGVTWGETSLLSGPWAIELTNGGRCAGSSGAHSFVPGHRDLVIFWDCGNGISLLTNLRRGGTWKIGSVRTEGVHVTLLGDVTIRRAFFYGLPPEMARQQALARQAVAAAAPIIRQRAEFRSLKAKIDYPSWVRMTLPGGNWARVEYQELVTVHGKYRLRTWDVTLARRAGRWFEARQFEPYCVKLPAAVRRQLMSPNEC